MSDQILTSVSLDPVNIALGATYGLLAVALVARGAVWGSLFTMGLPMILFGATRCAYYLSLGTEQLHDRNDLQAGLAWAAYLTPLGTVALYIAMLAVFFRWNHNIRKVALESMPASWAGLMGGMIGVLAIVFGALEMYFLTLQRSPRAAQATNTSEAIVNSSATPNPSAANAPGSFAIYILNALVIPYFVIVLYAAYGLRYRDYTAPYQTQTLVALAIFFTISRLYELVIKIIGTMLSVFMLDILGILLEILPELLILTAATSFNFASFGKNDNRNTEKQMAPEVEMEAYYPTMPDPVRHASSMRPNEAVSFNYAYDIEKLDMERENGSFDLSQIPPPETPFAPRPASQVPVDSSLELEDDDYEIHEIQSYPSPPEAPFTPRPQSQIPLRPPQAQFEPHVHQHSSYISESRSPSLMSSSSAGYSPQMGYTSFYQVSPSSQQPLMSYSSQMPSTSAQAYSYASHLRSPSLPHYQPQGYAPQPSHRLQRSLDTALQPPSPQSQTVYAHPQPKRPYSVNPSWTSLPPDLVPQPGAEGYTGPGVSTSVSMHSSYAMPVERINADWRNAEGFDESMVHEPEYLRDEKTIV